MTAVIDVGEMRTKMRIKESDDEQATMSKQISFVVRYGIPNINKVEHEGVHFYKLKEVLALNIFEGVKEAEFLEIVDRANQEKTRYDIQKINGENCIKAAGVRGVDPVERAAQKKLKQESKRVVKQVLDGRTKKTIDEEEFVRKWSLDPLARQKLFDLPSSQKQNAMIKFSPNPNVPNDDYSKLFVAFCKRFKAKAGDYGNDEDTPQSGKKGQKKMTHPVADAMPFCPGVPWYSTHGKTTPHLAPQQQHQAQQGTMYGMQLGMQNLAMSNLYNQMYFGPQAYGYNQFAYGAAGGYKGGYQGNWNNQGGANQKGSGGKGGKGGKKAGGETKYVEKKRSGSADSAKGKKKSERKKSTASEKTEKTEKTFKSAKSKESAGSKGSKKAGAGADEVTMKTESKKAGSRGGSVQSGRSKKSGASQKSKK